jgi:hypothetical protein
MIAPDKANSLLDAIAGLVVLASFMTAVFCVATLRLHVDEEKIRREESIAAILRSPVPPEHILTSQGRRRAKIAKIALGVLVLTVAAIVVRNLARG